YAVLGISVRGTGASEGVFTSPFAAHEGEDGKAVIERAGQQRWGDGSVGTDGNSYAGGPRLEVPAKRPQYLTALGAGAIWGLTYADVSYAGGMFNFGLVGQWCYETQPYFSVSSARLRPFAGDGEAAERRQANPPSGKMFPEMPAPPFNDAWWADRAF